MPAAGEAGENLNTYFRELYINSQKNGEPDRPKSILSSQNFYRFSP